MSKADDLLYIAASQIGYCADDDPEPGSFYGRWMAELTGEDWLAGPSREIWWCCIFVSWCLDQAGVECNGFPSYNTDLAIANSAGALLPNVHDAEPGDIVIFNWDGNSSTDHVGFIEANCGSWIQTIEGNVSNSVQRVTRDWSCVSHVIRPNYDGSITGDSDIRYMQASVNTQLRLRGVPETKYLATDGSYGPHTAITLVKLMQEWLLTTYDLSLQITGDWSEPKFAKLLTFRCVQATNSLLPAFIAKAALIGNGYKSSYLSLDDTTYKHELKDIIVWYQRTKGIPVTGCIDSDTLFALTRTD